jgi:hypothetical protein
VPAAQGEFKAYGRAGRCLLSAQRLLQHGRAAKYKAMETESASALLLSTLSLALTVPIIVVITR